MLRAELDAAFFHLYGLSRDDADYVMDTFPIVRKNDERAYGEYRTKRVILEIFYEMAKAERTGVPYQTRLEPRPADVRVAHASRVTLAGIPEMPSVMPSMEPGQEAAVLIWAMLYASGGTIRRSDLARAFALRNRSDLLARFAPDEAAEIVSAWRRVVGTRNAAAGTLAAALGELSARGGVDVATSEGCSIVKLNANAPANKEIDPWYRFEAGLSVYVLRALPTTNAAVDEAVTGDDRALLAS